MQGRRRQLLLQLARALSDRVGAIGRLSLAIARSGSVGTTQDLTLTDLSPFRALHRLPDMALSEP
jgi:hypothetical protein